jgi:hypothetical protein
MKITDKRELLTLVLGKTRQESEAVISDWQQQKRQNPSAQPATSKPSKRTALSLSLSDADLAQWDHLRDLLSHRLGSRDPNAALLWLIEQGLEKLDPVRQEARIAKRQEKKKQKAKQQEVSPEAITAAAAPSKTEVTQAPDLIDDAAQRPCRETARQIELPRRTDRKPIPAALKRAVLRTPKRVDAAERRPS